MHLQGEYTLNGRAHRVDARIGFDHVIDPYRAIASAPPPKTRFVGAQLHLLNRGPDPFPIQWARFRGYDEERGRPLPAGTQSTPLRKTMPDRPVRGQVLTQITGFTVPRGRRLRIDPDVVDRRRVALPGALDAAALISAAPRPRPGRRSGRRRGSRRGRCPPARCSRACRRRRSRPPRPRRTARAAARPSGRSTRPSRSVSQAAEGLAGQDVQPYGDQRAGRRVEQPVRRGHADQPVAEVAAGAADGGDLRVLGERVVDLPVARVDSPLAARRGRAAARRRSSRFIPATSSGRSRRRRSPRRAP